MYNGGFKTSLLSLFSHPPLEVDCPSIHGIPGTVRKRLMDCRKVHEICVYKDGENKMKELLSYWKNKNLLDIISTSEAYLTPDLDRFRCFSSEGAFSSTASSSSNMSNVSHTQKLKVTLNRDGGEWVFEMTERQITEAVKVLAFGKDRMQANAGFTKVFCVVDFDGDEIQIEVNPFQQLTEKIAAVFNKDVAAISKIQFNNGERTITIKSDEGVRLARNDAVLSIRWTNFA